MAKNHSKPVIIKFYSKVGTPELVFFICLMSLFFIPFIFDLRNDVIETILLTIFIFSLHYLIHSTSNDSKKIYNITLVFLLIIAWLRHFNVPLINFLHNIAEITIMWISFTFIFKSIFNSNMVNINTLTAAISGYVLLGIALGLTVFIYHSVYPDSFSFQGNFTKYEAYYYSFITMSTLGYGDIVPRSTGAKGLSILITLIGQFYMVIVMGLIIGKLLSSKETIK